MKVRLRFFARCREIAGESETELELEKGSTITSIREKLEQCFPELSSLGSSLLLAVNGEFAAPHLELKEGDEIALLPPMSGGQDDRNN
jgi:molybdopterin converting factor subunit 1